LDTGPRGLCIHVPLAAAAGLRSLAVHDFQGDAAPTAAWEDDEAGDAHVIHLSPKVERLEQVADQHHRGQCCSQFGSKFDHGPPRLESSQQRLALQTMSWS